MRFTFWKEQVASPIPLLSPERDTIAHSLTRAWKERRFVDCQEFLDQITEPLSLPVQQALLYIAETPQKRGFVLPFNVEAYRSVRVQAMRLLANGPAVEVVPVLADLLFETDDDIANNAIHLLRAYGSQATHWLLLRLTQVPEHRKEGNPQGYLRIIELLGSLRSPSTIHLLDLVLQEKFPVHRFNTMQRDKRIMAAVLCVGWGFPLLKLYAEALREIGGEDGIVRLVMLAIITGFAYLIYCVLWRILPKLLLLPFELTRKANLHKKYREAALQALARIDDVQSTPALIEYVHSKLPTPLALATLQHHLERVLPTTEGFTAEHINHLNHMAGNHGVDFSKACLPTLEHFGNFHSLTLVNRLALFGGTESLRKEAERVLPVLQSRIEKEREQRELLRASETPSDDATTLLRGVRNIHEANPEQELLHSLYSSGEDSGQG